jgi:hypothetical protein
LVDGVIFAADGLADADGVPLVEADGEALADAPSLLEPQAPNNSRAVLRPTTSEDLIGEQRTGERYLPLGYQPVKQVRPFL